MTGPRKSFESLPSMVANAIAGQQQFCEMAVYWGVACNSLDAQVRALLAERKTVELIEVSNDDMDTIRRVPIVGVPVYFSCYPDGITKMYPIPEQLPKSQNGAI